jgi:hypothetical protein
MDQPQVIISVAILVLGVIAAAVIVALRFNTGERRTDDALVPRHKAPTEAVLYREDTGVFVVHHAPDVAMIDAELVQRAKLGNTPNLWLSVATDHGDVLTFGTHEAGAGKVAYVLGGLRATERCYDAVRIA